MESKLPFEVESQVALNGSLLPCDKMTERKGETIVLIDHEHIQCKDTVFTALPGLGAIQQFSNSTVKVFGFICCIFLQDDERGHATKVPDWNQTGNVVVTWYAS